MALKTIRYTVDYSGITPSARQDGGVQGDHGVTDLEFTIKDTLFTKLGQAENLSKGKLYYRFDLYNGEGCYDFTKPKQLTADAVLVMPLEEWITRYGGIIKVVLVISLEVDAEGDRVTYTELYNVPAVLTLKRRPTGSAPDGKQYKSMSLMSIQAMKAAEQAAEDAEKAEQAADIAESCAESARDSVESLDGAEVIFKSELDAEGQGIPFEYVVDEELSETSDNSVKNKTIAKAINKVADDLSEFKKNTNTGFKNLASTIEVINKDGYKWYCLKHTNGFIQVWGTFVITPELERQSGGIYYSKPITLPLPTAIRDVVFTGMATKEQWLINNSADTTHIWFRLARGEEVTSSAVRIHAVGVWKQV